MAQIDTSLLSQIPSYKVGPTPLEQAQMQNALASAMGTTMQTYRSNKEAQEKEADNALVRQAYNTPDPVNFLAQQGRGDLANAMQQSVYASQSAKMKQSGDIQDFISKGLMHITNDPSDQNIVNWANQAAGILPPDVVNESLQQLLAVPAEKRADYIRSLNMTPAQQIEASKPTSFQDIKFGTYQPGDYTTASWANFVKSKDPADLKLKPTATEIKATTTTATPTIPKLKQGERWNSDLERVEQVPGSAEYIKQSKLHAKDYDAVKTVNSTTEANIANVDALLAAANAWSAETNNGAKPLGKDASEDAKAWVNLFSGGYSGYLSQLKSGKTASYKGKLDTLLANAKGLGLQGMRVGGSIGAITEKEWPMLAQQIITLRPNMNPADAAALITNVKERFNTTRDLSRDAYDTAWSETQYYKGASPASTDSDIKNKALAAFNSYDPNKYEYRINPSTGKIQRKEK